MRSASVRNRRAQRDEEQPTEPDRIVERLLDWYAAAARAAEAQWVAGEASNIAAVARRGAVSGAWERVFRLVEAADHGWHVQWYHTDRLQVWQAAEQEIEMLRRQGDISGARTECEAAIAVLGGLGHPVAEGLCRLRLAETLALGGDDITAAEQQCAADDLLIGTESWPQLDELRGRISALGLRSGNP